MDNIPVTATEVRLRQKEYNIYLGKLIDHAHKTWIAPTLRRIIKMYWTWEGGKRTNSYILKTIKTM